MENGTTLKDFAPNSTNQYFGFRGLSCQQRGKTGLRPCADALRDLLFHAPPVRLQGLQRGSIHPHQGRRQAL